MGVSQGGGSAAGLAFVHRAPSLLPVRRGWIGAAQAGGGHHTFFQDYAHHLSSSSRSKSCQKVSTPYPLEPYLYPYFYSRFTSPLAFLVGIRMWSILHLHASRTACTTSHLPPDQDRAKRLVLKIFLNLFIPFSIADLPHLWLFSWSGHVLACMYYLLDLMYSPPNHCPFF
jgi:hypothetical protein